MTPKKFEIVVNNVIVFHHAYLGFLLLGWVYPIDIIGLLIFLDDFYEHTIDENSPLRVFFDKYISNILN